MRANEYCRKHSEYSIGGNYNLESIECVKKMKGKFLWVIKREDLEVLTMYSTLAECYIDACAHEVLHCIEVENFYRTSPTAHRAFAEGRCKDAFIENFMRQALEDGKVKGYEKYKISK